MAVIKVADATNLQLNWLVATIEGIAVAVWPDSIVAVEQVQFFDIMEGDHCEFSTNPAQGQPILERESITTMRNWEGGPWFAEKRIGNTAYANGATMLVAGLRCWIIARLGFEVEIPNELLPPPDEEGLED